MKKIMMLALIMFATFWAQVAFAKESCESREIKLSQMKYIGQDLRSLLRNPDDCTIVQASTDAVAKPKCAAMKKAALNPGNEQYIEKDGLGTTSDNILNYYFCVNMNKFEMCQARIIALSGTMDISWQAGPGTKHHNNGDCVCRKTGSKDKKTICDVDPTPYQTGNSVGCNDPAAKPNANGVCVCNSDNVTEWKPGMTCPEVVTPPVDTNTNTVLKVKDEDLGICLADIQAAKAACSEDGRKAIAKCGKDSPEVNKNISKAQDVMQMGLDGIIARNANTGALEACTKMGAAGTTMIEALSFLKENCSKELDQCKKGCADVKAISEKTNEQHIADCSEKFEAQGKIFDKPHQDRFVELMAAHKDLANNADKFCSGDVQIAQNDLKGFINELAVNVQKADICKCQLTSASIRSGQTKLDDCDAINTPLTCIQNINQPGCSFSSVGCSPGSQIPGCRNPISAINPNGSGVGMPASGFAGPGFGAGGSGSGGAGSGKPGIDVGDVDFSDGTRPSGSGTATADAGSPFGSAAGSGSGSSGGPGGGSAEGGAVAEGEEKEKSSLSGFFQNTKSSIASLFGGGTDNKNSAAKKPDNKTYKNDVNGFRPKATVRGMANANEFGSKNRDIWKTMNERYNDQYHTFITVESPSK